MVEVEKKSTKTKKKRKILLQRQATKRREFPTNKFLGSTEFFVFFIVVCMALSLLLFVIVEEAEYVHWDSVLLARVVEERGVVRVVRMSALQVEWITFKKARKVIISEISRQLNIDEDCDYEQVLALSSAEEGIWKWVCDRLCYCTSQLVPKGYRYDMINNAETMKLLILPPLVSVICLVIACSISSFNFETLLPRIIAIVVIFIIMMLNVAIVLRYKKGARYEIKDQLRDILQHYISSIETHSTKSRVGSFISGEKTNGDDNLARHGLISGHSHVSIVSVYRENQWQRLPSLLLTKGDIISLMVS